MRKALLLALAPTSLFALTEAPWFTEYLECEVRPFYEYNFFSSVDNASPQIKRTFNTHVLGADFGFTYPENWHFETELEFASAGSQSWGYRSFALSARYLWLDDICCDPVSLTTGLVYRDASPRLRRALSTPYHGRANFELHTAIGKEWSSGPYWYMRTYGLFAIGQATSGLPRIRADLTLGGNFENVHQWSIYAQTLWGLGSKRTVPTKEFDGWGDIGHQSIDLGISYLHEFLCYGSLRIDFRHRVYARSYPSHVNFFLITYNLPFSIF